MGIEQEPVTVNICEEAANCGPEQIQRCAEFVHILNVSLGSQLRDARARSDDLDLRPDVRERLDDSYSQMESKARVTCGGPKGRFLPRCTASLSFK